MPRRTVSSAELRAQCTTLERAVLTDGLATSEQVGARKPGGKENPERGVQAWLRYFAWLHRTHAKGEYSTGGDERARADQVLLAALADAPAHVTLQRDDGDVSVAVYPKSHESLEWFQGRTRRIEWLSEKRDAITGDDSATMLLLERIGREIAYQYQLLVVAATTPGPRLPWDPEDTPKPSTFPEWSGELSPTETLAIRNAFVEVNAIRLQVITDVLAPRRSNGKTQPLGWATFFSVRAEEAGVSSATLLRDQSLASQIAAATLSSEAKLAAIESATPKNNDTAETPELARRGE